MVKATRLAGTGTLQGTTSVTAIAGDVAFSNLSFTNLGTITDSHATGDVGAIDVARLTAGGLVGDNSGTILRSFAIGSVRAGDYGTAGGLVGDNGKSDFNCNSCFVGNGQNNDAKIADSHAIGSVTVGAVSVAGGLVGVSNGTLANSTASGAVTGNS